MSNLTYRKVIEWEVINLPDGRRNRVPVIETRPVTDALGQDVNLGDVVTYPVRSGSMLELGFAVVTGIEVRENNEYGDAVVFHVIVPSSKWNYVPDGESHYEFTEVKSRLTAIERVVRLTDEQALSAERGWGEYKLRGERLLEIAEKVRSNL